MEVLPEELDFDLIPNDTPTWEIFSQAQSQENLLGIEREQLLDYQDKLDNARDLTSDGEISEAELAELEADLNSMMPLAVRRELPAIENANNAPNIGQEFSISTAGVELDVQSMDLELNDLIPK